MGWPIIFDNPGISLWWNMPLCEHKLKLHNINLTIFKIALQIKLTRFKNFWVVGWCSNDCNVSSGRGKFHHNNIPGLSKIIGHPILRLITACLRG